MTSDGGVGPTEGQEWEAIPDGLKLADGIDLDSPDPALVEGRRQCVAARKGGGRCSGPPTTHRLVCAIHAGLADPSTAARIRAERRRHALAQAEDRVAERRLGVRAALAAQLAREAAKVEATVQHLLDAGAAGDLRSAQALLPWIDQALGKPLERVETSAPTTPQELESLSTSELEALIASGRAAAARPA